jgi:hypothetical protein
MIVANMHTIASHLGCTHCDRNELIRQSQLPSLANPRRPSDFRVKRLSRNGEAVLVLTDLEHAGSNEHRSLQLHDVLPANVIVGQLKRYLHRHGILLYELNGVVDFQRQQVRFGWGGHVPEQARRCGTRARESITRAGYSGFIRNH